MKSRPTVVLVSPYGIENRGVRYIAASLMEAGFDPVLVFLKRWVNNDIKVPSDREYRLLTDLVHDLSPLLVGFGFGAPSLGVVTEATRRLRERCTAPVIWGGVHPTVCPEDCIKEADFVCIGEGEDATVELCVALADGQATGAIPGLWSRRGEAIEKGEPRPLIQDLDLLPMPAYMLPGSYFIEDGRLTNRDPVDGTAEYRIYPARGCPYQCTYCHAHVLRRITRKTPGRFYRYRSVEGIIRELEAALETFPRTRRVKFDSDVFAFPKKWIEEFSAAYRERVKIPFEVLTYPGELDEGDLGLLKNAGLRKLQTGIQSGSNRVLAESYGRKSTAGDIEELSARASRLGIEVAYDLIFDNPLSMEADKRSIVELLLRLERPFNIYLYSLTLFPRTQLSEEFLARGLVGPEDIEGRATKSFRQFRLSFDWPRSHEEEFWIALTILAAKSHIPRALVRAIMESRFLRKHPTPLVAVARGADVVKAGAIALRMLRDGELTLFKLRQYGSFKRVISQ